jgi:transposase
MLPGSVRILLASQPVDMRNSIDGLMALVRTAWGEDVYSGHLFVFVSRKGDRVKILTFVPVRPMTCCGAWPG